MRKAAALLMTAVLLLLMVIPANAFTIIYDGKVEDYPWDPIVLVVDGHTVETKEMPPIILNGRTMVPAREFFEELGAEVTWDNNAKRVIIEYGDERIILTINSRTVYIGTNSASISPSDPPPKIINDKTMIPVRFVAEEFGFKVEWLNETRTVKITSPDAEDIRLTNVVFSSEDDTDTIFIALDEFVNPNIFRMQNPDRLVIDVYGTKSTIKDANVDVDGQAVDTLRYSQHPDRFRVVADLQTDADYEVFKLKNGIEISIIRTGEYEDSTQPPEEDFTQGDDGRLIVVVDAGHGGTDPGATYPPGVDDPQVKEKDITLDIALKIQENLEKAGIEVIMTRDKDTYPTLKERVEIANNSNADLFVSVHINAMDNKDEIDGAQVYYHESSTEGKRLASIVYRNIIDYTNLTERGVQNGSSFYVLKHTKMPAILTEGGFITNEKDRNYLMTEKGRQAMADAISDGVLEALGVL
ncbi:MAG: N-acetylmuramoyl-L-alanine amidase [Clostridia bacterium]|nr:N-acetylmuramoyl-L-alanine amidase [Clostridia bacterium]